MEPIRPTIDIAQDIQIAGTPAAVFAALTKDIGGWWGHPFVTARAISLTLDPRLGGLFTERWENGGHVIASVTGWAQDEHLALTGSFHMGVGVGVATFDLIQSGASTHDRRHVPGPRGQRLTLCSATPRLYPRSWLPQPGGHVPAGIKPGSVAGPVTAT